MAGEKLIVVPRDVDDPGAFARFAQQFLDDVVMFLRPINPAPQRPDIDQIADDVERLELVVLQKMKQSSGVAAPGPEMDVGDPGSTIAVRAIDDHACLCKQRSRRGQKINCYVFATKFAHDPVAAEFRLDLYPPGAKTVLLC